ncbi:MAG: hypothetical protein WCO09_00250 [bacterium]
MNKRRIVVYKALDGNGMVARLYWLTASLPVPNKDPESGPYFEGRGDDSNEAIGAMVFRHGENEFFGFSDLLKKMVGSTLGELGREVITPSSSEGICPIEVFINTQTAWRD